MPNSEFVSIKQLSSMSLADLHQLLSRENALISKKKFLQSLPDGGQKVKDFVAQLEDLISKREESQDTALLMAKMRLADPEEISETKSNDVRILEKSSKPTSEFQRSKTKSNSPTFESNSKHSDVLLRELINNQKKDVVYLYEGDEAEGNRKTQDETLTVQSYQKLMEKQQNYSSHFRPSRDLKISKISELPDKFLLPSPVGFPIKSTNEATSSTNSERTTKKSVKHSSPLFEEPKYVFSQSKIVSLSESFQLQQKAQEDLKRIQAQHAVERLNEKLVNEKPATKIVHFSTSYRQPEPAIDSDDDVDYDQVAFDDNMDYD